MDRLCPRSMEEVIERTNPIAVKDGQRETREAQLQRCHQPDVSPLHLLARLSRKTVYG
jgi:hypothetical protein